MSDTTSGLPANRNPGVPSSGEGPLQYLSLEYRAEMLRRGYQVVANLDPVEPPTLARWLGREPALVAAVCKHAKGGASVISEKEYEVAVHAGRVGRVLLAGEHARPIQVPQAFGDERKDIERLARRLHAFGFGKAVTPDNLRHVPLSQMKSLLDNARKLGFLDEGQAWATKTIIAKCLSHDLGQVIEKNKSLDRGLLR